MERVRVSRRNDVFQILETYRRNRTKRTKGGIIFAEGVIPLNLLRESGFGINALIFDGTRNLSDWAVQYMKGCGAETHYELTPELMDELSDKDNPSELIALARQPSLTLKDDFGLNARRLLILDRPSNQGNLGAIIRSCDAFGIGGIVFSGHSVDPFDPKTISSSRGTVFKVPLAKAGSNEKLSRWAKGLKEGGDFLFLGSSAKGRRSLSDHLPLEKNIALIIGNETWGMNEFLFGLSDDVLTIPMMGKATSLNIACAASVMIWELSK